MKVTCPSCAAAIPAADVHLANMAAKCAKCDSVFSIAGLVPGARRPKQKPPLPKGLDVVQGEPSVIDGSYRVAPNRDGGELVVKRRWFQWSLLFLTVFVVFWDGAMATVWIGAFTDGNPAEIWPTLLHVSAGVGLTYFVLAGYLNRTTLRIGEGRLTVRHGPVPWFGNRDIATDDIRQLYLRKKSGRKQATTFEVHCETKDRAALVLMKGMPKQEQAEYIEWVVEQHLGIEDDPSYDQV